MLYTYVISVWLHMCIKYEDYLGSIAGLCNLKYTGRLPPPPTLNFLLFYDQNKRDDRIETDNSWLMRLATYLFMNVVGYMVCAFNWCFKCSHLLYCRRVCLLSGLIFLSLLEKRPLRIANSDNLPETVTGWGWECMLRAFSSPISKPYIIYYSPAHIDMWFFFFYLRTNSRWQTQKSKEEQKNSICNFLSIPPWLQTDTRIILASVVVFFLSFSIFGMIVFEVEVRYIVCDVSMQSGCHQPPVSTF